MTRIASGMLWQYKCIKITHPKNEINKGRPIRDKLANELCETCGREWGAPVSCESILHFETIFKANCYIIGFDQIPLLGDTCNIYNTLLYKNEKRSATQQFGFL